MRKFLVPLLLFAALFLTACGDSSSYETIAIQEVTAYESDGYQIVDVRELNEYQSGHIQNAINLPLSQIEKGEYGDLDKEMKYIIICRSGNRSKTASDLLNEQGYEVVNVDQGMSSWTGETVN